MFFRSKRPLSHDRAWSCVSLNFSVSGMGTLRAGRIFSGICQLGAVLLGAFFVCAWFVEKCRQIIESGAGGPVSPAAGWLWKWGIVCIGISWSWMLLSCLSLMRQAKADEGKNSQNLPPRLADLSGISRDRRPNLCELSSMEKLSAEKIGSALAAVPQWGRRDNTIARTYQFKDFPAAIQFVNAVAGLAEKAWHHPDIDIRWNKVTLTLTTHDAGGLTEKDFTLAQQFDRLSTPKS